VHTQAVQSKWYAVLYYKRTESIGLRRKFGNKSQSIGFGGKVHKKTERWLRGIADECLRKLHRGDSEETVKLWADGEVRA